LFAQAPDSARTHQFLAESYVAQRRDDKAAEEYKAALKANPQSVEVLCALGDVERWLLRLDDAVEHYSRARELAPNDYCGNFGLGVAHLRRHELPSAIEFLRRAAVMQPNSGETRLALGSALLQTGDVTGALPELKAAVANKPDLRQAYALLARVYRRLGQPQEAEESRKKAQELEDREHDYVHRALVLDDLSLAPSPDTD
jgi:Tfp pilus assembly protein PilF